MRELIFINYETLKRLELEGLKVARPLSRKSNLEAKPVISDGHLKFCTTTHNLWMAKEVISIFLDLPDLFDSFSSIKKRGRGLVDISLSFSGLDKTEIVIASIRERIVPIISGSQVEVTLPGTDGSSWGHS